MHLASCLPGNHSELPDTCIINARDDEARHSRAHARGLSVPAKKKKQENDVMRNSGLRKGGRKEK